MKFKFLFLTLLAAYGAVQGQSKQVPGAIVCHQPPATKEYIGSPSLAILPNGYYVASHDFFGPASSEWSQALTDVFISKDKGHSWQLQTTVTGAFWSSLFVNNGTLYLIGPDRHYGMLMIRKSIDEGKTWSKPTNNRNGVLLASENLPSAYHCAPVPVVQYNGRLWRPLEAANGPEMHWGTRFGAMVISAPIDADLLNAKSWTATTIAPYDSTYLNGNFRGWLEGNFVVDKSGHMWDMLRVSTKKGQDEKAAMVSVSDDGKSMNFDPVAGFIPFDGGSKKFAIRYDSVSKYYWTLVNTIPNRYKKKYPDMSPDRFRNTLTLRKSKDLFHWQDVRTVLESPEVQKRAFQYVDWCFDKNDIIFLSRTAFFDGKQEAHSNHDANYLTFHRIQNFRAIQ